MGAKRGPKTTGPKTYQFRISARRRPTADEDAASDRLVADEELVHELWTHREALEKDLNERLAKDGVASVRLTRVDVGEGVTAEFEFKLNKGSHVKLPWQASAAMVAAVAAVLEYGLARRVSVSAVPVGGMKGAGESEPWGRIAPILAFIATGIGVIGFVTFVGGAVVWARLNATGLPATPSLSIIPGQDLLVIGAETLVPQFLLAFGLVILLALGYVGVAWLIGREKAESRWSESMRRGRPARLSASRLARCSGLSTWRSSSMLARVRSGPRGGRGSGGWGLPSDGLVGGFSSILILALLAAIIGSRTGRFLDLAATTFLLVGVFEGYLAYMRESSDQRVRGAAVMRENKTPVIGLFVAEGANRVYIARVSTPTPTQPTTPNSTPTATATPKVAKPASRLVGILNDEISDVAIGDRKSINDALDQGRALARELCDLQIKTALAEGAVETCATTPPPDEQGKEAQQAPPPDAAVPVTAQPRDAAPAGRA